MDTSQEKIQMAKKRMKRSSTFLVNRKMKIKTTMRYHYTSTKMAKILTIPSVGKNMKQVDFSHISGRSIKLYGHFGKKFGCFLETKHAFTIQLKFSLLGIYPREMKTCLH